MRSIHDSSHHPADALGGGLDVSVTDVCVAQRHLHLGVAEQTRHNGQRNALHCRLAGKRVSEIVQPDVLQSGPGPDGLPGTVEAALSS